MARKRTKRSKNWGSCSCPSGSKMLSTKGRGRGFVCLSKTKTRAKNGRMMRKFVKAKCR